MEYRNRTVPPVNTATKPVQTQQKEIKDINERRRACTIDVKMQELLLRQLVHEMYNHNLYRTFANYFGVRGLAKLEEYYVKRAEEEKLHHDWIYSYLNDCDAEFVYPSIPAISEKITDILDPFKMTVDKEIQTTTEIYEIVDYSVSIGDWATFNWLNGNSKENGMLVNEQVNFCLAM